MTPNIVPTSSTCTTAEGQGESLPPERVMLELPTKYVYDARVWVVTGTSSGLGEALVKQFIANGERVVATVLSASMGPCAPRGLVSIVVAAHPRARRHELHTDRGPLNETKEHFGRLDIMVNNATIVREGEFEAVPDELARQALEVELWGPSMGGFVGYPTGSSYVADKFAHEGLTKWFTKAMLPERNIKSSIIEPGGMRTNSTGKLGTDSQMIVKGKAMQTIAEAEKYENIAHSTNAEDVTKDDILKFVQH
ncbi:hypothetical protein C8Q77DRAFT_1220692 [Trametes polyzona]|nr:hypothetical protein C8Q77DRAFT_1220692 [Trametes polyzona]